MTHQEILIKAFKKADIPLLIIEEIYPDSFFLKVIFSHPFAKAFWGEDRNYAMIVEIVETMGSNRRTFRTKLAFTWQYHLQIMVLEKDPIKYLEKFL